MVCYRSSFTSSNGSISSSNTWYAACQGNTFSYYALSGGFNAAGLQTSGSSFTYNEDGGNYDQFQSSEVSSKGNPTATNLQMVTGDYADEEGDYAQANSDGSVTGSVQANSTSAQTTNTFTSLVGPKQLLNGTADYNDAAANTDVGTTTVTTNLSFWPTGAQYGTIEGVATDDSVGSFQVNVQTDLNKDVCTPCKRPAAPTP